MPGAIAAGLYALVGAGAITIGVTAITIWSYVIAIGGMMAIGKAQQRRAQRKARDAYNAGLRDRTIVVPSTDAVRSRVYGKARNADALLFHGSHGAHKEKYVMVLAVAGHEVAGIPTVYFNDEPVELDADGWVRTRPYLKITRQSRQTSGTITAGAGSVNLSAVPDGQVFAVATYGSDSTEHLSVAVDGTLVSYTGTPLGFGNVVVTWAEAVQEPKVRVWKFLGSDTQNIGADTSLRLYEKFTGADGGPLITTTEHRFAGIASVAAEFDYDQDALPNGVPQISALVEGAFIEDTRFGPHIRVGGSANPAWITRDWALYPYGGAALTTEMDEASFLAAGNACDVEHEFATGVYTLIYAEDGSVYTDESGTPLTAPVTQTLPMYEAGIVCKLDRDPWQQLGEMVEAMGGKAGWAGGQLRVRAGQYTAPVAEITEDWISDGESIQIVPAPSRQDLVNVVTPTIASRDNNYVVAPVPEIRAEAYITLDGAEYPREVEYGAVTSPLHAQHVAGVSMRDMRSGLTLVLPCNMRAYPLELFDVVTLTLERFGWEAKIFEVVSWKWSLTGGILLGLKETDASIFDPDEGFDEADATPNTSLPKPWEVPDITGLTLASGTDHLVRQADGTIVSRIFVQWDAVQDEAVTTSGRIEVRYGLATEPESQWQTLPPIPGSDTQAYIPNVTDGALYLVKARAANTLARGKWSPMSLVQVIGKSEPPHAVDRFKLIEQPGGTRMFLWDYLNPPADLLSFEVRYTPGSTIYAWEDMLRLFAKDRDARQTETVEPVGDGVFTFAICAIDTTGNTSEPLYITEVLDGDAFGSVDYYVLPHQERWPGTRSDCVLQGADLADAGTLAWADLDMTWAELEDMLWSNTPSSPIVYEHTALDRGTKAPRTIRANAVAIGTATAEMQYSDDGASWSAWIPVPSTPIDARHYKFRWSVAGTTPRLLRAQAVLYLG